MKTLHSALILMPFVLLFSFSAAGQSSKEKKAAQTEQEFQKTKALIESNRFLFKLDHVFSQDGHDLTRFSPEGSITVTDSLVKGHLPFFGRAYSLPYGEGGGIEFDGIMKDRKIKIENRKRKKSVIYRFSITGQNDTYQITMDIAPGGNCSVNLNSNNRAPISYSGQVTPLAEDVKAE